MSGRTYSLCMDVANFLRTAKFPADFSGMLRSDAGRHYSPHEARDYLRLQLHHGHKVIPCDNECSNPCKRADRGCTGFDYAGGGCPGRLSDTGT